MSTQIVIVPASPALVRELAPAHAPSHELATAAVGEVRRACAHASGIYLVGSRDARWRTAHTGSFRAWGAPDVTVGSGNFLPELVQRYLLQLSLIHISEPTRPY